MLKTPSKTLLAGLVSAGLMTPLLAQAQTPALGWNGTGEAGFNSRTGNNVSESLNARLRVNYIQEVIEYKSLFEIQYRSENNDTTSERYVIDLQADRYLNATRDFYAFVNTRGERDKFADLDSDLSIAVGLGRVLYRTDASLLKGEAGIGYQTVKFIEKDDDFDQATGRLKLDFDHQFNETYSFVQDLLYFAGPEQYKVETNTGLRAALNSKFSVSASYKYRYNSNPGDAKKTDGETNLSLIYRF
ncbi:YdiY family protein [Thiomicrospira sp. ALE5]|uniref:DUF481 domain-containing protein n=1 Tax=Thiomicrospira sp. ALE5 TaxID=748650 RepID=UPI0008ED4459|nr:DUF481 domain-containing protein [Thiomicrospira sp. ALE5]SFR50469.1 putative salt-induced outer membrane protein [Thiomicrospira sp. ALE5]